MIAAANRLPPSWVQGEKLGLPKRVLYYGVDEPLPEQVPLRAGPLSLVYENGDLRYIRLGDREILRRVYVAIRDRNWGTLLPRLSNVKMEIARESFRISYEVENKQGEIDFLWNGSIVGDGGGGIRITMEGVARSTFLRNRIGFCVLHPVRECAGQPCTVEHVDGKVVNGTFPLYISPHQPFLNMRAISHEVAPGLTAEVRMEGDTFEMEDQRNWSDASYKTYCTPLRLPFPAEVKAGTTVSQSVTLKLKGAVPTIRTESGTDGVVFTVRESGAVPLPRIGLCMASHGQPLSPRELARLRALNLSHLRVDVRFSQADFEAQLRRAAAEAGALRLPLEIALTLSDDTENRLRRLRSMLDQLKPSVARWLVFHTAERSTTEKWIKLARQILANYDPKAGIGAGSNTNFTELNRGRPPVGLLDWVTYSINPQVHAFDNASMVENLAAQAATVESARQFMGSARLAVSPVTLRPRLNPAATGPEPAPGELPSSVDVRQMSLFGAGWTLGSIKYLAEGGADSVTYYQTTGWRGVMETERGSPLPAKFRSLWGAVFPLYHVLDDVGEFAGGKVVPSASNTPLAVDGLVLRKDGKTRVLLANFTDKEQSVQVKGVRLGKAWALRILDETNAESAIASPEAFRKQRGETLETRDGQFEIHLRPYAVARMDRGDL